MLPVVGAGFEVNAIGAWLEGFVCGKKMFTATVGVSSHFIEGRPLAVYQPSEGDGNACGWPSQRGVENVCGDAHD